MAEHLVSIYGTEKDKVNCPFYYKIGACRHGDRCSRVHNKPLFSQTILLENLYQSPDQITASAAAQGLPPPRIPPDDLRHHFDDFYHDVYEEMASHGRVEQLHVCENLADHLAGNTYVKFRDEEAAQAALAAMQGRWYAGRPVKAEFSPVTDFKEGKCRPFERYGQCERGDYCHFMHLRRHPAHALIEDVAASDPPSRRPERRSYRSTSSRERGGSDRYAEGRQSSPREHGRSRGHRDDEKASWHDSDRRKDRERGWERDRRDSFDRERSRDYHYGKDKSRDRDRDRDRDRYGDYERSYKSSRERERRSSFED